MFVRKRLVTCILFLLLPTLSVSVPIYAQNAPTVITLAVPDFIRTLFTPEMLTRFEAENPGVRVQIVVTDLGSFALPMPAENAETHLQAAAELAATADVAIINRSSMTLEATRAGYWLDLSPLIASDPTAQVEDFLPTIGGSFIWNGGVWGAPALADVITAIYEPAAFDAAGVTYPDETWTLAQYGDAARALAQRNADNQVGAPGLIVPPAQLALFLRSLTGARFYDDALTPRFATPELEAALRTWAELSAEGVVASRPITPGDAFPLVIGPSETLNAVLASEEVDDPRVLLGALLPGGVAGIDPYGFAVSAGTQYPDAAYALAKFLTFAPEIAVIPFGVTPARRSMVNAEVPAASESGAVIEELFLRREFSPENAALLQRGVEVGLPLPELLFESYVARAALATMSGQDALVALSEAESAALDALNAADAKRLEPRIAVATPIPQTAPAAGEITLTFGVQTFINPLPNRAAWERLMADFAASDPQVGQITLNIVGFGQQAELAQNSDCFYLPFNHVPNLDLSTVFPLDPLIDVDPMFSASDLVGDSLPLFEREGQTWALPIALQPFLLAYDSEILAQAGITVPEDGWPIEGFADALRQLYAADSSKAPYDPNDFSGTYLLMLIAAYGGMPVDFRVSPSAINFTDPATVDAIRQALDLARDGLTGYSELGRTNFTSFGRSDLPVIYTQRAGGNLFAPGSPGAQRYQATFFPTGSQFAPLSHDITTAYISANTPYADACYRWIRTLARAVEVYDAMPAYRSVLSDPQVRTALGEAKAASYDRYDARMQMPGAVVFPSQTSDGTLGGFLRTFWLKRAFDAYVLEDADLEVVLAEAQTHTLDFLACNAALPPYDPGAQSVQDRVQQIITCAVNADPSMAEILQNPGGGSSDTEVEP